MDEEARKKKRDKLAKDLADLDQSSKALADTIPLFMWALYQGHMKEGFTEVQAFRLVRDHLIALIGATSRPDGSEED